MKTTLNWLRDFVETQSSAEQLGERLTLLGAEVEGMVRVDVPPTVVAARVIETEPDTKRRRITWCRVDAGGPETIEVACGAPNVRPGLLTALAREGTVLGGDFEVGVRYFGSRPSRGMLCSGRELGVSEDAEGILELEDSARPGEPLSDILGLPDAVFEIDITPNRPDLLSVLGLAREIAAAEKLPLRQPSPSPALEGEPTEKETFVRVEDPDLCPRYCARLIRGVRIGPSPQWLRRRLEACGIRAINNVVDATNYVMLELGQPLHAFDFSLLRGGGVSVRRAREGEEIVSLDENVRKLDAEMLVIADDGGPVAVAGVMGGKDSEVGEMTADVFLESAHFTSASVRRTSRLLGLVSESSRRFERIVDPNLPPLALDRLTELILATAGGTATSGLIDAGKGELKGSLVEIVPSRTSRFLGIEVSEATITENLERLGLVREQIRDDALLFRVPTWRPDLERPADLIEETARLVGYNRIPAVLPERPLSYCPVPLSRHLGNQVDWILCALGLDEVITYSFMGERDLQALSLSAEDERLCAPRLVNPVNKEQNFLRTTLIPGLLRVVRTNQGQGARKIACFETGTVFRSAGEGERPREWFSLGLVHAPGRPVPYWGGEPPPRDFFSLKGNIEALVSRLGIAGVEFTALDRFPFCPGQTARISVGEEEIGVMGTLVEPVAENFSLEGPIFVAELDLDTLLRSADLSRRYRSLPAYPAVERDIALVVEESLTYRKVRQAIETNRPEILETFDLFDVYVGEQVPAGKKSLAIRLQYRSPLATLNEEEVNAAHLELVQGICSLLGGELR